MTDRFKGLTQAQLLEEKGLTEFALQAEKNRTAQRRLRADIREIEKEIGVQALNASKTPPVKVQPQPKPRPPQQSREPRRTVIQSGDRPIMPVPPQQSQILQPAPRMIITADEAATKRTESQPIVGRGAMGPVGVQLDDLLASLRE